MASNPVFNAEAFERAQNSARAVQPMTLQGTINKSFFLLFICVLGAWFGWQNPFLMDKALWIIMIAGGLLGLFISLKPRSAPFLAPVYALAEGLCLGVVSLFFNKEFPGIVLQAVSVTLAVFLVMLTLYKTKIIRPTAGFIIGVLGATCGVALFYLVCLVLMLCGVNMDFLTGSSRLAIGINLVICAIAAANLVLDFNFIDEMTSKYVAPKYMEWYAGFGLLVTLVWLYWEILKALGKSRRR